MAESTDLIMILQRIYNTKEEIRDIIETESLDFVELPVLIQNFLVDMYNKGYVLGYNKAWTEVFGETIEIQGPLEHYTYLPPDVDWGGEYDYDSLTQIMYECLLARQTMKDVLITDSDMFETYPDRLRGFMMQQRYDQGYEDGYAAGLAYIETITILPPTMEAEDNYIIMTAQTSGSELWYKIGPLGEWTLYWYPFEFDRGDTIYGKAVKGEKESVIVHITPEYENVPRPTILFQRNTVTIVPPNPASRFQCYYTIDGNDPAYNGILYEGPFPITHTVTVRAVAWDGQAFSNIRILECVYNQNYYEPLTIEMVDSGYFRIYIENPCQINATCKANPVNRAEPPYDTVGYEPKAPWTSSGTDKLAFNYCYFARKINYLYPVGLYSSIRQNILDYGKIVKNGVELDISELIGEFVSDDGYMITLSGDAGDIFKITLPIPIVWSFFERHTTENNYARLSSSFKIYSYHISYPATVIDNEAQPNTRIKASGSVMSLWTDVRNEGNIYYDTVKGLTTFDDRYTFNKHYYPLSDEKSELPTDDPLGQFIFPRITMLSFYRSDTGTTDRNWLDVTDASDLIIDTDHMPMHAYENMFKNSINMTAPPELITTDLNHFCFARMFENCTSLFHFPTMKDHDCIPIRAYYYMFYGCTSLVDGITKINAQEIDVQGLAGMFSGCTSLIVAPELPATKLWDGCYMQMFENCTSLKYPMNILPCESYLFKRIDIDGRTAWGAYNSMFKGCTSLALAPQIMMKSSHSSMCQSMFENCTSLTLPPPNLYPLYGNWMCYNSMFKNCTSLTVPPKIWLRGDSDEYYYQQVVWNTTLHYGFCCTDMFYNCINLLTTYQLNGVYGGNMFYGTNHLRKLIVPCLPTHLSKTTQYESGFSMYDYFTGIDFSDAFQEFRMQIPNNFRIYMNYLDREYLIGHATSQTIGDQDFDMTQDERLEKVVYTPYCFDAVQVFSLGEVTTSFDVHIYDDFDFTIPAGASVNVSSIGENLKRFNVYLPACQRETISTIKIMYDDDMEYDLRVIQTNVSTCDYFTLIYDGWKFDTDDQRFRSTYITLYTYKEDIDFILNGQHARTYQCYNQEFETAGDYNVYLYATDIMLCPGDVIQIPRAEVEKIVNVDTKDYDGTMTRHNLTFAREGNNTDLHMQYRWYGAVPIDNDGNQAYAESRRIS